MRKTKILGDLFGALERRIRQDHHELVASVAALEVAAAEFGFHLCADRREHCVTTQVTVSIVDLLEIVEIEHDERQGELDRRARRISPSRTSRAWARLKHPVRASRTLFSRTSRNNSRVLQRHGQQCRRRTEDTALVVSQWRLRGHAQHSLGGPGHDHREAHLPGMARRSVRLLRGLLAPPAHDRLATIHRRPRATPNGLRGCAS